jgi:hypothetical protein
MCPFSDRGWSSIGINFERPIVDYVLAGAFPQSAWQLTQTWQTDPLNR